MAAKIIDTEHAKHYGWGANCDAWFFLKSDSLTVIREQMPPGSSETMHYHEKSQQFFYVVEGVATFEIDGKRFVVRRDKGIYISPGSRHRVINESNVDLHLLVISEPNSHDDRINV